MFTYGFWFYHELQDLIGMNLGGDKPYRNCSFIQLSVPTYPYSYSVKVSSPRFELFRQNPKCVSCDRIGSLWILEAHHRNEAPHLNLYHVGEPTTEWKRLSVDGLVLITKDHVIPRSKGGASNISNYVTMCSICNGKKGDRVSPTLIVRKNERRQINSTYDKNCSA